MLMLCRGTGPLHHQEIAFVVEDHPGLDCPLCELLVGLRRLEDLARASLPLEPLHPALRPYLPPDAPPTAV